jgi:hypothetical protein
MTPMLPVSVKQTHFRKFDENGQQLQDIIKKQVKKQAIDSHLIGNDGECKAKSEFHEARFAKFSAKK